MQDRRNTWQRDAGHEEFTTRGAQGHEECMTGGVQDMRNARQAGYSARGM